MSSLRSERPFSLPAPPEWLHGMSCWLCVHGACALLIRRVASRGSSVRPWRGTDSVSLRASFDRVGVAPSLPGPQAWCSFFLQSSSLRWGVGISFRVVHGSSDRLFGGYGHCCLLLAVFADLSVLVALLLVWIALLPFYKVVFINVNFRSCRYQLHRSSST